MFCYKYAIKRDCCKRTMRMTREKSHGGKVIKTFRVCAAQISLDRSATAFFNNYYVQASNDQY